jgi:hypothetical protein
MKLHGPAKAVCLQADRDRQPDQAALLHQSDGMIEQPSRPEFPGPPDPIDKPPPDIKPVPPPDIPPPAGPPDLQPPPVPERGNQGVI